MADEVEGIDWIGKDPARVPGCFGAFLSHCGYGDCCGVNGAACCDCCGCAPGFCCCGCEISEVPSMTQPKVDALLNTVACALLSLEGGRVVRELIRLRVVSGRPRTIAGVGRRTEACLRGGARAPTQARPPLSQPSVHLS